MRMDGRRSTNIEDLRGSRVKQGTIGGGIVVVFLVIALLTGADPSAILSSIGGVSSPLNGTQSSADAELVDFVSVV